MDGVRPLTYIQLDEGCVCTFTAASYLRHEVHDKLYQEGRSLLVWRVNSAVPVCIRVLMTWCKRVRRTKKEPTGQERHFQLKILIGKNIGLFPYPVHCVLAHPKLRVIEQNIGKQ